MAPGRARNRGRSYSISTPQSSSILSSDSANIPEPFPRYRVPSLGKRRLPYISPAQYAKMSQHAGKVKSVMSGDTAVISSIKNPSVERIVSLAYTSSPRLNKDGDEPWAFESRDFLRKALVGKNITFEILYQIPNTKREYVVITSADKRKFPEESVQEGWIKVREDAGRKDDTEQSIERLNALKLLESQARAAGKGIWASESSRIEVQNDIGEPQAFAETWKGKTADGLVERVLSGDRVLVRLIINPKKHVQVMCLVAGIRAPSTERHINGQLQPAEECGSEAKAWVEERFLQRNVKVDILGVSPQNQLIATVRHPNGSLARHLLGAGLARCTDNHSTLLGKEMATLRQAEKEAQEKKLCLHKSHVASTNSGGGSLECTVTKIFSADVIYIRNKAGVEKRVSISSVRGPRQGDLSEAPFRDEAKEFLRKRVIGKHVKLSIDGSRPATGEYDAKEVATVIEKDKNIGLLLVQEGWCSVIRHKRDDTDRAPNYDDLLAAQEKAKEEKKGMWSGKPTAAKVYVDASETPQKARMQLGALQRQKKIPSIVDFVKSGSRFTILIPRDGLKLNFVLGGVQAPKFARNPTEKSELFGQEAHDLATRRLQQRDVQIDVHNIDKTGGFIGEIYINRESFAKILVEEGLATVHQYSAEQSGNATELNAAQDRAKQARKNMWKDWNPSQDAKEDATEEHDTNGNTDVTLAKPPKDYREVVVTNIEEFGKLKLQVVGAGTTALDNMMKTFKSFHINPANSAGLPGPPKAGDFVAAKFSEDGEWYRARIRSNDRTAKQAEVVYIDYGNSEKLPWTSLRPLSQPQFSTQTLKPQAVDAILSFLQLPTNKQYLDDAIGYITQLTAGSNLVASVDHTDSDGILYVTLYDASTEPAAGESINAEVVSEGLAMVPRKLKPWEKAFSDVLKILTERERVAKDEERRGMWEYGDLTED
jgi:staphylococcal nuclease domain-containing protein 1